MYIFLSLFFFLNFFPADWTSAMIFKPVIYTLFIKHVAAFEYLYIVIFQIFETDYTGTWLYFILSSIFLNLFLRWFYLNNLVLIKLRFSYFTLITF